MTMSQTHGRLLLSIDVPNPKTNQQAHAQLLSLFDQHHIPATWSLTDPTSKLCQRLIASATGHEVALLATNDWAAAGVGRTRFAQQITARLGNMRQRGADVSTLALADCDLGDHIDLLVKHRLNVVRTCDLKPSIEAPAVNARSLRYGVWQANPHVEIPHATRWWRSPASSLSRLLQAATEQQAVVHLRIDADAVAQDVRWTKALETLVTQATRLVEHERLVICPLRAIASELGQTRTRTRRNASVLRRAA